jgi:hypothetical protein
MRDAERSRSDISAKDFSEAALRCTDARIRGAILAVGSLDAGMALTTQRELGASTWRPCGT